MNKIYLIFGSLLATQFVQGDEINSGDTAWILTSTALVLLMTLPGLALFYGGLVRSKNVLSVLMQCFTIACLMSVCWVVYGYSLAFKGDGLFIGDLSALFLNGVERDSISGTLPESVFITFQMTFAIITPALVVGAFAERMKFTAMCIFSVAWFTFVYLPACHMVWGGGYLGSIGVIDFAGGLVVHATCGIGALVAAIYLGQRNGFMKSPMPPHNRTMVMIGASMLWVGWFGFNGGSALGANGNAASALLATHLAAATASLVWMVIEWVKFGKPSLVGIATGMVAGLATVTPASGFIGPLGGIILGFLGGYLCYLAVELVRMRLHLDDSLDVFAVHGVGGILGSVLLPVMAMPVLGGFGAMDNILGDVGVQAYAVMVTIIWTGIFSFGILYVIRLVMPLRVHEEDEFEGLDITQHGERGYHGG